MPARRVLIVDDHPDIRMILRLTFDFDDRFDVVAEATNGIEAVDAAARARPEIIILDREMPVAGGIEVLPRLRAACPEALIVLFTANADLDIREAATVAGADAIRSKTGQSIDELVEELEDLLLRAAATPRRTVQLRIGPVAAASARRWVANTQGILQALLRHPEEVPPTVSLDLLGVFGGFLDEWAAVAAVDDAFHWAAAAPVATIEELVAAWAELDLLPDDTLARLGCHWSPPEAKPFFDALTLGVVAALERNDELEALAAGLPDDWSRPLPALDAD